MRTKIGLTFFGIAACLGMAAPARAFDAPAAEPAQSVKTCSGQGFFYIPGIDTCLQAAERDPSGSEGGSVRMDNDWGAFDLGIDVPKGDDLPSSAGLANDPGWQVEGGLQFGIPGTDGDLQGWVRGRKAEGEATRAANNDSLAGNIWNGTVVDPSLFAGTDDTAGVEQLAAGLDLQLSGSTTLSVGGGYSSENTGGETAETLALGSSIFWTPVENLDLGLMALYRERLSGSGLEGVTLKARIDRDF